MNTPKTHLTLLGIALGILLALLLAPQTRWLVRLQTLMLLHQYRPPGCASYSASPAGDTRAYDAVAARHPNDYAIQDARATVGDTVQPLINLRALTRRFPNSPLLYADILREECRRLHLSTPADFKLSGLPMPTDAAQIPASSPEEFAAYDKEAAAGERVDPDNAYFPMMLAYGLFAVHKDADALAAVERASAKPIWNEYLTENVAAQWRLHAEAFGDPGAMPQAAIWGAVLLPEYQHLRQTARIVAYQAVLKEQAGHREDGYELREALRRCGDLMRVQSTTLIGSLVGIAISAISEDRPGGVPYVSPRVRLTPEQMAQHRLDAYCAYVTKIGHPEAARRARDEEAARREVQALADPNPLSLMQPILYLTYWWMGGIALLLNAAWLLGLGLLAAGHAKLPLTPKPPIGWQAVLRQCVLAVGLWVFLALLFVCVSGIWITAVYHAEMDWRETFGVGGTFALVTWLVAYGLRRLPRPRRLAVLKTALLLPVLVGAVYSVCWLVQWAAWPLAEIPQGLRALTGVSNGVTDSDAEQALQTQTLWVCAAAMLAVPLLLALVLSGVALVRRVSVFGAVAAGFQKLAVPVACLLLVVYGGVLIGTLRQERRVAALNRQIVLEGGRYFAAQAGQPWPGPVQ